MFANLASALIKHEQITTTLPKAKDLRRDGRTPDHARPSAATCTPDVRCLARLPETCNRRGKAHCDAIGRALSADRPGGYTRVLKHRLTAMATAAPLAVIELVERDPDAKGQDSGPMPGEAEEEAEAAA